MFVHESCITEIKFVDLFDNILMRYLNFYKLIVIGYKLNGIGYKCYWI